MLECAFVGLDHCSSIFTALASILVPLDPFYHSWGFISTAPLLHPPLELPRLLPKTTQAASSLKPSALVAPSAWEAHSQISTQLAPSLFTPRPSLSPPQKGPSCPPGKSRAPCFVFLPSAFYCLIKLWI